MNLYDIFHTYNAFLKLHTTSQRTQSVILPYRVDATGNVFPETQKLPYFSLSVNIFTPLPLS